MCPENLNLSSSSMFLFMDYFVIEIAQIQGLFTEEISLKCIIFKCIELSL